MRIYEVPVDVAADLPQVRYHVVWADWVGIYQTRIQHWDWGTFERTYQVVFKYGSQPKEEQK